MAIEPGTDRGLSIHGVAAAPGEQPGSLVLRIETSRGPIEAIIHTVEGGTGAVIFVGGAMGGLDGPADKIYSRLPAALAESGVSDRKSVV